MAGFARQLARIANSLSNIAGIVSGFDSHRPLQTLMGNIAPFRRLAPVDLLRNDQFSVPACFLCVAPVFVVNPILFPNQNRQPATAETRPNFDGEI
jgi:hypothetical protein